MKKILLMSLFFASCVAFSQNKEAAKIEEEGKLLYRVEKASWYGTDDFLVRFKNKKDRIGGYLSYETENHNVNTIFFSRYNADKIIARYQFDSIPKQQPILIDSINTTATKIEKELIVIRQDAMNKASENKDGFFSFYKNTALNFIPIITKKEKRVFVLTGPQISGVVLLGNDYLLRYSKNNKFKEKEKIHNSMIQLETRSNKPKVTFEQTMHSHVLSDYINATDICTLLLYKEYVEWKKHIVISEKQVSIFDLEKETLVTMTRKAWGKVNSAEKN